MILIAGLGNPGAAYAHNRHNIGFRLLGRLIASTSARPAPLPRECAAELFRAGELLLCRPQSFMNASGLAIAPIARFYKCERLVVLHDEMELAFGRLKLQIGGSCAGHNGLKSVAKHCGASYERLRLGIGRPDMPKSASGEILPLSSEEIAALPHSARSNLSAHESAKAARILAWVLGDFSAREEETLEREFLPRAQEALACLISQGLTSAQNLYNR